MDALIVEFSEIEASSGLTLLFQHEYLKEIIEGKTYCAVK